jgi:hypothetical protein
MSTTALQAISAAANWHLRVNENFDSVSPSGLYGRNPATTTGLTWGYLGGNFNGVSVASSTVALTASNTNYVVAHRTTGAVTVATTTTNWLNTATYMQLYQIVAGASTVTSYDDKRQAFGAASPSGTVSGADKQIQYNASGAFGAEAGFEYDYSTNTLTVDKITLNGLLLTLASATGGAGIRLPHGAAPTSPTNGDVWTTTAGMYARINGSTVGPFAPAGGSVAWGSITGTLSSQTDLQTALNAKGSDRSAVSVLTPSAGVVSIDCSLGDYFTLAPTANVTSITFSNLPAAGKAMSLMVRFTQDTTARTVAWPASFKWAAGSAGSVSTGSGAKDLLAITTHDQGTTWFATLSKAFA